MTRNRKIYIAVSWVLVAVCMVVIFALSAQVADDSKELSGSVVNGLFAWLGIIFPEELIRSVAHMLEFTGLSVLIFNAAYATWESRKTFLIAFAGTVLYAITDEIHQIFVEGRAFQFTDILIDSTGALLGAIASLIILRITKILIERRNKNGSTQALQSSTTQR